MSAKSLWVSRVTGAVGFAALLACSQQSGDDSRGSQPPAPPATDEAVPGPAAAQTPAAQTPQAQPAKPEPPPPPTFGPANLTKLSAEERTTLLAGAQDKPIPVEIHYIQSNETRHDLFFPYIEGKGGAFIGVASDPSFTMMAAARAELAFIMDIDYRVIDLHRMYEVFIPEAETPEALHAFWDKANARTAQTLLEEKLDGSEALKKRILQGYRVGRETVFRHLQRVITRDRDGKNTSWLSDPQHYAHVRAMYHTDRVRIMSGDLTGAASLQSVAAACKALDVPVKVLYMSNAEEYFKYSKQFLANIDALPIDEGSMLLRTIYSKKWEHADLWAYQVQPIEDFRTRIAERKNRGRNSMLFYARADGGLIKDTGVKGFSRIGIATAP